MTLTRFQTQFQWITIATGISAARRGIITVPGSGAAFTPVAIVVVVRFGVDFVATVKVRYCKVGMIIIQIPPTLRTPCLLYTSPSPRD